MTSIKAIVLMLWILLALTFSGCAAKVETVYVPQKCLVEKPKYWAEMNCRVVINDLNYMQCIAENYTLLKANFEMAHKAYEGCK